MTPDRESRVEGICHDALALDGVAREAFVADACAGDDALRREVESLLRQESKADGFLAEPALAQAAPHLLAQSGQSLIGRKLGTYQIQSLLGAGGMGEVYRARDTKLGRDVAIKILPPLFVSDAERRARFEREARMLASLNHPHIGAIYGLEDVDGIRALVLELVEGPTLADRLAKGPLPVSHALAAAAQIAEALEVAHEKGIVHRDLKPANVVLTSDGRVKVLDFGLAKAVTGDTSGPELTQSPTIMTGGTKSGVILGTAAYMSPEQARGLTADKRTDIWAFGCVLFELLTGRAAFEGETTTDIFAAIIEREPRWAALPHTTPDGIRRLLRRCLEKDPTRRLRDIGDARIEIEDVLSGSSPASAATSVVTAPQRFVRLSWSIAAVALLVGIIAVGALTWGIRNAPRGSTAAPRISRMTIASSGTTAVTPNDKRSLAITPDGTRVVYIGNGGKQLFVRPLDQLEATVIATAAAPLNFVFVTPDGQYVGFEEGATIKKVAITGGPVTTFVEAVLDQGVTWAPNDTIITGGYTTGLQRVSAGGAVAVLTKPAPERGEQAHAWPETLPDGRAVLFTVLATKGGIAAAQVAMLDLATGTSTVLVRGGSHAHYVSSGHLVYTTGGTLKAVPFDLVSLTLRGTPVTVLPHLFTKPTGAGQFVVAVDGTLAYVDAPDGTSAKPTTLMWVDRQGREEPLMVPAPPYSYRQPRMSPDGTRVALVMSESGTGPDENIWVWNLARQKLTRLTLASSGYFFPVWTPDGHRLIFGKPGGRLFWQSADGTGTTEALEDHAGLPSSVTPDGRRLLLSPGARDVMMLDLDSRRIQPLLASSANERNGVVSPNDGRWLAYESDGLGQFEIYVKPFPDVNAGQWKISTAGGTRPLWAPNGQELFYVAPDGAMMAARVHSRGGTWGADTPVKLFSGPYATGAPTSGRNYDVSADGTRFLMVKEPANQAATSHIVVVQNWFEELRRLAPPN
jgi:serine/threonine protein kinase/Tol biopolymer transport system component